MTRVFRRRKGCLRGSGVGSGLERRRLLKEAVADVTALSPHAFSLVCDRICRWVSPERSAVLENPKWCWAPEGLSQSEAATENIDRASTIHRSSHPGSQIPHLKKTGPCACLPKPLASAPPVRDSDLHRKATCWCLGFLPFPTPSG